MKLFHAIGNYVSGFWNTELEPWLMALGTEVEHDIVTQVFPLAQAAFAELAANAVSGNTLSNQAIAAGTVLTSTAQKVEQAAINATIHDVTTAVAAVFASQK